MIIRVKVVLLGLAFCLSFLQAGPSFAQGDICKGFFLSDKQMLANTYEAFLKERNKALDLAPTQIQFKNQSYKVVDFLGDGIEGSVFRVADAQGKKSIMKVFSSSRRHIVKQVWDYHQMNKRQKYPYTIIAVDYKDKIFQFEDMRGLPMRKIGERLKSTGASEELISNIYGKVAMEGYSHYEQNTLFDIDRLEFIAIDPH